MDKKNLGKNSVKSLSVWGDDATASFYSLTPDSVLDEVEEHLGVRATGRVFALNSMENRVYDIEIEDEGRDATSSPNFTDQGDGRKSKLARNTVFYKISLPTNYLPSPLFPSLMVAHSLN